MTDLTASQLAAIVGTTPEWWWPKELSWHDGVWRLGTHTTSVRGYIDPQHAALMFEAAAMREIFKWHPGASVEEGQGQWWVFDHEGSDIARGDTYLSAIVAAVRSIKETTA